MKVLNIFVFFASLVRGSLSQYPPAYLESYLSNRPYNQPYYQPQYQPQQPFTNEPLVSDPLISDGANPNPLLNYLPVLNTNYGEWPPKNPDSEMNKPNENEEPQSELKPNLQFQEDQKVKLSNHEPPSLTPALEFPAGSTHPIPADFEKLNDVMSRMKTEMERLNKETKCIHVGNLGELNQLQKLRTDLKVALENTKQLKNDLRLHEKQITEISEGMKTRSKSRIYDQELTKEFTKMVEHLEKLVERLTHKRLLKKYKASRHHG